MLNDLWVAFLKLIKRMVNGVGALTSQDYTSVNIKYGRQFEAATYSESTAEENIIIQTGSKPVLLKALDLEIDGNGVQYAFYIDPEYTTLGDPIQIFNVKHDSPNESTTQMDFTTTLTNVGNQISPVITILGSNTPGTSTSPTAKVRGFERPLAANSTYLIQRLAIGGTVQASDLYMTWYEGKFDYNG